MALSLRKKQPNSGSDTRDMIIEGYTSLHKVFESPRSRIFRAKRQSDQKPVILKILQEDYLGRTEIARYKNQFQLLNELQLECAPTVLGLAKFHNAPMLVFEDVGAVSLRQILDQRQFSIRESLVVAVKLAGALIDIHAANIIHKDINPSNVLYDPDTQLVKVIDFGISTRLLREQVHLEQDVVTEGSLPYMSPEQTGRMNRFLDYRTDLYSLGVTIYEMLAGQLPFQSEDPLQLIHYHIAKKPICLKDLDDQIPIVLSNIVDKLLQKDPEKRYQSAWGLRADLQKCLDQFESGQQAPVSFPLALQDVPDKFHIPETLYGRQHELESLHQWVAGVRTGQREMVLISGNAGVGKSSLIKELYKTVSEYHGLFISGKFEEFARNRPYSGLASAFGDLIRQILSADEYTLACWRVDVAKALGPNARILVEWLPELELIIGPQPEVRELGPVETENRFRLVFRQFVRVITQTRKPFVIYLDDLQWVDYPSTVLVKLLVEDRDLQGLMVIGAYRHEAVSATHPLERMLKELAEPEIFHRLHLEPLGLTEVTSLIADALYSERQRVEPLAELVLQKTGGNPFFTDEFLRSLYEDKKLFFDPQRGCWNWDLEAIKTLDMTDNVVQLMTSKICKLELRARRLITLASCIGNVFDLTLLAKIAECTPADAVEALKASVREGLVIPIGDAYRLIELEIYLEEADLDIHYKFAHDRILQAAREMLPAEETRQVHRQVGRELLQRYRKFGRDELIFSIVAHLNAAGPQTLSDDDRLEHIRLNLDAARRAKSSTAYELTCELLGFAKNQLLKERDWTDHYDLALAVSTSWIEVLFLSGQYETMDKEVKLVLTRARDLLDKIPVYETMVQAVIANDDMWQAVETGKSILDKLGMRVPEKPSVVRILWEFIKTKWALRGKKPADLLDLPELTDPMNLARIHFQYTLTQCIFLYMPQQVPIAICSALRISLKHGNSPTSALIYTTYGIMLAGILGQYDKGYSFGELGRKLYERLQAKDMEAATLVSFNLYLRPWKEPIRASLKDLQRAYQSGLEAGNHEFATHAAMGYCYRSFLAGVELDFVDQEMQDYASAINQLQYRGNDYILSIYQQLVENLRQPVYESHLLMLTGSYYDEAEMLRRHQRLGDAPGTFLTYFAKLQLAVFFGDAATAQVCIQEGHQAFKAGMRTYNATVFLYYEALTYFMTDGDLPRAKIKRILKSFRHWAKHAPGNHSHRQRLLAAEWARVNGRAYKAQQLYDEAIALARTNSFLQDEALAQELAARFHLNENRSTMAVAYMKRARHTYERWGAYAKIAWLEEQYPQILNSPIGERPLTGSLTTMSSSTIDLTTLKKALLAIAEETIHSRMLEKIISSAIEFAGAQKGVLLLRRDQNFVVEAEREVDQETPKILQAVPYEDSGVLCPAVINYVKRTKNGIVIDNAQVAQEFIPGLEHDPYIKAHEVRSVLCIPVSLKSGDQADMVGLLYLENNQVSNAFTEERIETLEIICLSAAGRLELSLRAATDGLTGLYNHEYFQGMLEKEILQSQRQLRNLSLIMIDIDHFKSFNDQWGHQVGDLVLKHVADQIKQACRKSDIVARYGGEELSVILPETSPDMAYNVAERIRQAVADHRLPHGDQDLSVTVSLGVSYLQETIRTARALVERADEALYLSKHNGRNRVTMI